MSVLQSLVAPTYHGLAGLMAASDDVGRAVTV